jgi:DNA polymerase III epsilon subunit-like protein
VDPTLPTDAPGPRAEAYVSIDIETAGPVPARYSMLSIGACLVDDPDQGFYVELRPELSAHRPEALAVSGLSMEELAVSGVPPVEAMTAFDRWLTEVVPAGQAPVFVAFNASFDWMFVADAFERHLGRNPFGHAALDVKAYAMGASGSTWAETSMRDLAPRYLSGRELRHHALEDARDQAELFRLLLAERATQFGTPERTPS